LLAQVAVFALANKFTRSTGNCRDCARIPGLLANDWFV
jgi:hypothetical protein